MSWEQKRHNFVGDVEIGDQVADSTGRYMGRLIKKEWDCAMVENERPGSRTTHFLPAWMELSFSKVAE